MRGAFLVVLVALVSMVSYAQTPSTGGLTVILTRAGQPLANATVCLGVSGDLNQFSQGLTNAQGRVNLGSVPNEAFIVTARAGNGGAQQSFAAPASPSGIPFMNVSISVPATGGPSCPTTAAGPQRRIGSSIDIVITPNPVPAPIVLTNNQRCFGALGNQCGPPAAGIPLTALCLNGECFINPGSWEHDECCFDNPNGMACRKGPLDALTGHDGNCVASWDLAVRLSQKGIMWKRNIDFNQVNGTGTVAFNIYCAPANSLIPPGHAAKCCSGLTRALNVTEALAATVARETLAACR